MLRLLSIVALLGLAAPAHAQLQPETECGGRHEAPLGIGLVFGSLAAGALAAPTLLQPDARSRPGAGGWQLGMGYQSAPHSVLVVSNAGAYLGAAPWLGLEGRTHSRTACTGVDSEVDALWLAMAQLTPPDAPIWLELLAGGSLHAAFGGHTDPHLNGGPTLGARFGAGLTLGDVRLIAEWEGLGHLRYGTGFVGERLRLEAALRLGLAFASEGGTMGPMLEARHAATPRAEPRLPDSTQITLSARLQW